MGTYYDDLNVSEQAGQEVIRAAYKVLAQKWHPDKNRDRREEAESHFKRINTAFEVLSNISNRAEYDAQLKRDRSNAFYERSREKTYQRNHSENTHNDCGNLAREKAEARQDGRRSKEQGFKLEDCPYTGVLASEWIQGFSSSSNIPNKKSSWFIRLWHGDEGLGDTFWLYGVVGGFLVFIISVLVSMAVATDPNDVPMVIRTAQTFYIAYYFFVLICIWRAAGKIRPMSILAIGARCICLLALCYLVLYITAFVADSVPQY